VEAWSDADERDRTQSLIRMFNPERVARPKSDNVASGERPLSAQQPSVRGAVIAFVVLVCLLIGALTGRQTWDSRNADMNVAEQQTANVARSLSQQVTDSFQTIDAVLVDVVGQVESDGMGPAQVPELRRIIQAQVRSLAISKNVFVISANGDRIADALPLKKANYHDRAWFIFHRTHADLATHIGPAVRSRIDGTWVITASRRVNRRDDSFGGVVVATVRVKYFEDLYRAVDVGKGGTITLVLMNGTVLVRKPESDHMIGKSLAKASWFRRLPTESEGSDASRSIVDGVYRFYSFSRVQRYPLVVLVGFSQDEVLKEWRWETWLNVFEVGAVLALLITLGNYLVRQIRDREAAESELARLALVDGLTGLGNRRHFDDMLEREWHRAVRARTPFAFLMIDVDAFKAYNDHYGHRAGDRALKAIAACIAAGVTRAEDLAVRYGGEEFAVLLPATDESGAFRVAETIRRAIAALGIPHDGNHGFVTVSVGVAGMRPARGSNSGTIVEAADMALYAAKRNGRNRSEIASARVSTAG
jgi:diguanylate cyclase (GGDEF)-like protein